MGRGDKRTRRGKIFKGSYGNARSHKVEGESYKSATPATTKKAPATKKTK